MKKISACLFVLPNNSGLLAIAAVGVMLLNNIQAESGALDSDGDGLSDAWESGSERYQFIPGGFTWSQAKADAESRGGHLATITSSAESDVVYNILTKSGGTEAHLGGSDLRSEGDWEWVTGETWNYTRWNTDPSFGIQPDNHNDNQNILAIFLNWGGAWDDNYAYVTRPYILEFGYPTDPNNPDTDGDGLLDGVETATGIYVSPSNTGTKPNNADTDSDGLKDGAESLLKSLGFDPNINNSESVISLFLNPNNAFLYTQSQFNGNRSAGQSDVINNSLSYGLYDSNSIMDLRMGGLMIQRQGTNAVVSFQPQTTTDLTQPFTNNGAPITNEIPMPGNKGFLRIQAGLQPAAPPALPGGFGGGGGGGG